MSRKQKRGRTSRSNAFKSAPKQGIDSQTNERFQNYSLVSIPASAGTGFFTVRIGADVNGYSWTVTKNGVLVSDSAPSVYRQTLYSEDSGLFPKYAGVFAQYRMNMIKVTVEPTASGAGIACTPILHLIDEDNVLGVRAAVYENFLNAVEFMQTGKVCSPQKASTRSYNYNKWLGQTMPSAWLQTNDPANPGGTTPGIRQVYPTQKGDISPGQVEYPIKRCPAVSFVFGVNVFENDNGVALGFMQVEAHYSFRIRNLIPTFADRGLKPLQPVERVQVEETDQESQGEDLTKSTKDGVKQLVALLSEQGAIRKMSACNEELMKQ